MTVFELCQALLAVDQNKQVWVTFAKEDERPTTCITSSRYGIHILDTDEEISVGERVIFNENAQEEEEKEI